MSKTWKDKKDDTNTATGIKSLRITEESIPSLIAETERYDINRPLSEAELSYYQHYTGLTLSWLN